jgi:hypothetical protein
VNTGEVSRFNAYTHGTFYAYYGGIIEGTFIARQRVWIATERPYPEYSREVRNNDSIINDPPVGLPPMDANDRGEGFIENVCTVPISFNVLSRPYSWTVIGGGSPREG